jgi:DNA polymerase-4
MEHDLNKNAPLVMHIDLNSCFATVTQQAFPHLRGKPLVMAAYDTPNGCVLSPSMEAKKYGIKTGSTVREAKVLCKDVIVRMTDTVMVRDVHVKMKKIFNDYSPDIAPKSIDEVVLDFSSMERLVKTRGLQEIAKEIKARLRAEVGEWISCSIGIAPNRFLAKLAAGLIKPDGLVTITHENLRSVYSKLSLTDLPGINVRYEARLNMHNIFTPIDFLNAPLLLLKKQVFQSINGYYWYLRLRGYEQDGVDFKRKSFGQDYALKQHTSNPADIASILMKLCEKMGRRLRRHTMAASGIHIAIVNSDGTYWHKGRMTQRDMYTTQELFREALFTFNKRPEKKRIGKLCVSCYGLHACDDSQQTLFDDGPEKSRKLSDAVDKINDKYGEYVITPLIMMGMGEKVLDRIAFGAVKELEDLYAVEIP